jgi:hypothetical protein
MSTSKLTRTQIGVPLTPMLSIRFVDRDMFARYRGGGIGHKYMREVEARYENMSLRRIHGKRPHPGLHQDDDMDVDNADSDDGLEDPLQPSGPVDRGQPPGENGDGSGDSDESDATASENTDSDEVTGPDEDEDEVDLDGGNDNYGLPDL